MVFTKKEKKHPTNGTRITKKSFCFWPCSHGYNTYWLEHVIKHYEYVIDEESDFFTTHYWYLYAIEVDKNYIPWYNKFRGK